MIRSTEQTVLICPCPLMINLKVKRTCERGVWSSSVKTFSTNTIVEAYNDLKQILCLLNTFQAEKINNQFASREKVTLLNDS